MADDDQDQPPPSLEPPSFFKRKKPKAAPAEPSAERPPPPRPPPTRPPPPPARPLETEPPPVAPVFTDEGLTAEPVAERPDAAPPPPFSEAELEPDQSTHAHGPLLLPGPMAAGLIGLLVGAFIGGATAAAMRLCAEIEGTESCGNPGILLLFAILVVAVVLSTLLLRMAKVPETGSTSFLAIGLLSVVALLFLVDRLLDWQMLIAIPLLSVLTYLVAHWVTATYVDSGAPSTLAELDESEAEVHDVR